MAIQNFCPARFSGILPIWYRRKKTNEAGTFWYQNETFFLWPGTRLRRCDAGDSFLDAKAQLYIDSVDTPVHI
jgi:hypothetical protein